VPRGGWNGAPHSRFELHLCTRKGSPTAVSVNLTSKFSGQCLWSIVPIPPRRVPTFRFPSSKYARCHGSHHDLRKFITELAVAQRCVVLSSGREATCDVDPGRVTVQHWEIVGRLTRWAWIESSTAMGSDQTAAEALQEAETESVSR
jgi:hypothetical protein